MQSRGEDTRHVKQISSMGGGDSERSPTKLSGGGVGWGHCGMQSIDPVARKECKKMDVATVVAARPMLTLCGMLCT